MSSAREVLDELRTPTRELRRAAPEAWAGFGQMHDAAVADGALPRRIKELMALAIAVAKQCDGCIASHARAAAAQGATPEELAETLSITVLMDGGPGTVYAPPRLGRLPGVRPLRLRVGARPDAPERDGEVPPGAGLRTMSGARLRTASAGGRGTYE